MDWRTEGKSTVCHRDGHRIELKAGSWEEPFDLHPTINKGTSAIDSARLIREGVAFATESARDTVTGRSASRSPKIVTRPKTAPSKDAPEASKFKTSKTLSLKSGARKTRKPEVEPQA